MLFPICCFVGGLIVMGKTKPITQVHKLTCLGPRSGIVYSVEDFREIGVVVVRAPNQQAMAQFLRMGVREPGKAGLIYQHGVGSPALLAAIRADFGIEVVKPKAVAASKEKTS